MESCVNDIITITQCWFRQHETNKQSKNGSKRYTQWIFITLSKIQGIFYTLKFQNASFTGDKYICLIFFAKYQQHLVDEEWFVFRFVFIFKVLVVFHGLSLEYIYIYIYTLLAKKVVTPPLKTIKPMWIELLCFHLAEIGMIWTRDCSPTKSDTTLGRHSMQGQVGSSSSETTV